MRGTMNRTPANEPVSFETFRAMIADALQLDSEDVVREASFVEDLQADSIQLVEMMMHMEEMGIDIPIESAWEIQTVGDAYRLYRDHAASSQPASPQQRSTESLT